MRLHRIRLRDFRGVHDREVSLAEHGVTVLQGDNEVGKTSTLVALDLLFDAADSSRRAEIRAAQPAGVDAGPEVEAEVSTGPYRFVYRKRWLRRPRTELHVTAPAPEQLTGADAHARVTAILDETMDRALWRGLRVEQNGVVGQADLGGQDALTRALDRAASGPGASSRADPSADDGLIDRAAEELRRYRTPSGRATGELRAAEVRLADAEAEEARCRAALEAVERDVAARDRLDADAAALKARKHAHTAEVTGLEDTWAALQSRLREVDAARQHAVLARERADAARERREARDALVAAVEDEADTGARAAEAVAAHEAEHSAARDERDARRAADTAARARAGEARRAADAAERAVSAARDRAELADLAERLRRVDEAGAGLAAAERALAASTVDADDLDELEDLARDVVRAEAARDAAAARVELAVPEDAGELTVVVDGETVVLAPGGSHTLPVAGSRALSLPGVLDVRVTPGLDDAGRDDAVRERSRALAEACEDLGVADLEAARAARRAAEDAARRADEHRAALARELAGHGDAPRCAPPTTRCGAGCRTTGRRRRPRPRGRDGAARRRRHRTRRRRGRRPPGRRGRRRVPERRGHGARGRHPRRRARRARRRGPPRAHPPSRGARRRPRRRARRHAGRGRDHAARARPRCRARARGDGRRARGRRPGHRRGPRPERPRRRGAPLRRGHAPGARARRDHRPPAGRRARRLARPAGRRRARARRRGARARRRGPPRRRRATPARDPHPAPRTRPPLLRGAVPRTGRAPRAHRVRPVAGPRDRRGPADHPPHARRHHRALRRALQRRPGAARAVCAARVRGARRPVRGRPGGHRRRARTLRPRAARPPRRRLHRGHLGARRGPGRGAHLHARALPRHRRGDGRAARAVPQARRARRVGALGPRGRPGRRGHAGRNGGHGPRPPRAPRAG
ncbi:AAA family ATPase [Actinomycetospora sp. CA-053990]|uniref:AAA family ATPase n=1 Tax=Actinomycetospora sp. CA-053990 TaxID=3239891 RepID=UPI003D8CC73E